MYPCTSPRIHRRSALLSLAGVLTLTAFRGVPRLRLEDREAFLRAVRAGDLPEVERMLVADASLAVLKDEAGRSAYVLAHLAGSTAVAERLAKEGFALDVVEATLAEDWARVEALIDAEPALADRVHPIGGHPLYARVIVGGDAMWRLRSFGCGPDVAAKGGFSAARAVLEHPDEGVALRAATELLGNGGSVNTPQAGGDSFLHGAARRRSLSLLRLALRKGARLEARDVRGRTALDVARSQEWSEGVALLETPDSVPRDHRASRFAWGLDGGPVRQIDLSGVPAKVQQGVTGNSHNNLDAVRKAVAEDPRLIWSLSADNELAIEASAHVGNVPIMEFHLEHGAPLSLPTAVSLGERSVVLSLLDRDPLLVHERGAHDMPVLWYAVVSREPVEMASLLVENGVSLEQESAGNTALHVAARRGRSDLVAWLIEAGADVGAVGYTWNTDGETPLGVAREAGQAAVVGLLEEAGAPG